MSILAFMETDKVCTHLSIYAELIKRTSGLAVSLYDNSLRHFIIYTAARMGQYRRARGRDFENI